MAESPRKTWNRPAAAKVTQATLPIGAVSDRPCLACQSVTQIVMSGAKSQPVERCTSCGVERELPRRSRRAWASIRAPVL